jgi:hypothetical protein
MRKKDFKLFCIVTLTLMFTLAAITLVQTARLQETVSANTLYIEQLKTLRTANTALERQCTDMQRSIDLVLQEILEVDVEYATDFPGGVDLKMQIIRQELDDVTKRQFCD